MQVFLLILKLKIRTLAEGWKINFQHLVSSQELPQPLATGCCCSHPLSHPTPSQVTQLLPWHGATPSLIPHAAFQVMLGKMNKLMKPQKIKTKTESTQKVQFMVSGQLETLTDLLLNGVELDHAQRVQQLLGDF